MSDLGDLIALRTRISQAVTSALQPRADVLAGWEGGSAAFDSVDGYSDIDLHYIATDEVPLEVLYRAAAQALETISPITVSHAFPLGRYYKLTDGGEFLFVDLIFFRSGESQLPLEVERHGHVIPLFDKGDWLRPKPLDEAALAAKRETRYQVIRSWFPVSQSFVWKCILRGHDAEAVTAFWAYTIKPLVELVRMRYCPVRWDFGMRYLERDLPTAVYERLRALTFIRDVDDLRGKLESATSWGNSLLRELDSP